MYEQKKKTKEIAGLMGTCRSGTHRIRQYLRERGMLEPKKGYAGGLTVEIEQRLRTIVADEPGARM